MNRRNFIYTGLAAAAVTTLPSRRLWAANVNEEVNVGFISCGGRSNQLMSQFSKVEGVNIGGLCDPDSKRVAKTSELYPKAKTWTDMREMLDDPDIDAVVVATCNHWHCLAAIWAMEKGKHVYVEKPLSHSQWEGDQTVAAARRYDKICQIGTQQRSDPMQEEAKQFLHEDKVLGKVLAARVNRYGVRGSIGKRDKPREIEKDVNYDLWLGPAQDVPVLRKNLHYDWHWDWNTGSGEMGNWGVHVLDDVRNVVFQDSVNLPKKIMGGGGRVVWDDAGQTPNVHVAYFDTGGIPVVIGLSNLPEAPKGKRSPKNPGPSSGYVAYCEGGEYHGQRGKGKAIDNDGKVIKEFGKSSGDVRHQQNFIDAVRAGDRSMLNAEVEVGHASTGWCNMANIAFQAGSEFSRDEANEVGLEQWQSLLKETDTHLNAHGMKLDDEAIKLSSMLTLNDEGQFVGDGSAKANKFLKREYRAGYEVPELAMATTSG